MFDIVNSFEKEIAKFYNAPFAIAVDCCTHAIELSLIHSNVRAATCPTRTYISVPFTLSKLNIKWSFEEKVWTDFYFLGNTNIIDAAVYWKQDGYVPGTYMCLSFQYKKHLNLHRGGAILVDNYNDYLDLKKLSYDGRDLDKSWAEQDISSIGYHYYMTPETAKLGLSKIKDAIKTVPKNWSSMDYPYLPNMSVFK